MNAVDFAALHPDTNTAVRVGRLTGAAYFVYGYPDRAHDRWTWEVYTAGEVLAYGSKPTRAEAEAAMKAALAERVAKELA